MVGYTVAEQHQWFRHFLALADTGLHGLLYSSAIKPMGGLNLSESRFSSRERLAIIGAYAIASVRAKPKIALPNNCLDNPGFRARH